MQRAAGGFLGSWKVWHFEGQIFCDNTEVAFSDHHYICGKWGWRKWIHTLFSLSDQQCSLTIYTTHQNCCKVTWEPHCSIREQHLNPPPPPKAFCCWLLQRPQSHLEYHEYHGGQSVWKRMLLCPFVRFIAPLSDNPMEAFLARNRYEHSLLQTWLGRPRWRYTEPFRLQRLL